jgi:hypothetical protein
MGEVSIGEVLDGEAPGGLVRGFSGSGREPVTAGSHRHRHLRRLISLDINCEDPGCGDPSRASLSHWGVGSVAGELLRDETSRHRTRRSGQGSMPAGQSLRLVLSTCGRETLCLSLSSTG